MAEVVQPLTVRQMDAAFSGPALATNRFFITTGHGGVRIAFCEEYSIDMPAQFRTAVIMSIQDATSLKDVLTDLLKKVEEALAKALPNA